MMGDSRGEQEHSDDDPRHRAREKAVDQVLHQSHLIIATMKPAIDMPSDTKQIFSARAYGLRGSGASQ
jgi:hypothetical protein